MRSRLHIKIHGDVQGVFFRAGTQEAARNIGGITGWVRNMHDGTVECIAEGEKEKLKELLEWCRHGPSAASVERIEEEWEEYTGEFEGFEIRYEW